MDNVTQKTIPYNVLNYDNYTVYHLHSDYSNANGYADSCSKFKEYIKLAKKQNMKALAFSEHGNCYDWIKVASFAEAWIEIFTRRKKVYYVLVASFAEAWIEISDCPPNELNDKHTIK